MARNPVQLQKGISLNAFLSLYGTEDQCFETLYQWRWPNGFLCPHCGHDRFYQLISRKLQQCNRCHRQSSIIAGTIFDSTKLPLTVSFQAIYVMTQDKKGVSAMKLHRNLGISYNAAWRMRHKLMQEMMELDRSHPLGGSIQLDDVYLDCERSGGIMRSWRARQDALISHAVQTNVVVRIPVAHDAHHGRGLQGHRNHRLGAAPPRYKHSESVSAWVGLLSWRYRGGLPSCAGGGGQRKSSLSSAPSIDGLNTILGNIKNALRGTDHATRLKYAQQDISRISSYRFNRRFDLPDIIPIIVYMALRTPPMPERLLGVTLSLSGNQEIISIQPTFSIVSILSSLNLCGEERNGTTKQY